MADYGTRVPTIKSLFKAVAKAIHAMEMVVQCLIYEQLHPDYFFSFGIYFCGTYHYYVEPHPTNFSVGVSSIRVIIG